MYIKEYVKLYILTSGGINPEGSRVFGTGVWVFLIGILKSLARKPTSEGNDTSYRHEGSCILKNMPNYIFYQEGESFKGDLT